MHYGQTFQSHALHFFHLCSPDILFGFDADPAIRNVIGVIDKFPDLAVQGVMMRKYGQEIIKATAGKKIHGTGAIPGGINKNLSLRIKGKRFNFCNRLPDYRPRYCRVSTLRIVELEFVMITQKRLVIMKLLCESDSNTAFKGFQ